MHAAIEKAFSIHIRVAESTIIKATVGVRVCDFNKRTIMTSWTNLGLFLYIFSPCSLLCKPSAEIINLFIATFHIKYSWFVATDTHTFLRTA